MISNALYLQLSLTQAKREQNFYIEKAEVSKKLKFIGDRKKKRDVKGDDKQDDDSEYIDPVDKKRLLNVEKSIKFQQKHQRLYTQIEPKHKKEY